MDGLLYRNYKSSFALLYYIITFYLCVIERKKLKCKDECQEVFL